MTLDRLSNSADLLQGAKTHLCLHWKGFVQTLCSPATFAESSPSQIALTLMWLAENVQCSKIEKRCFIKSPQEQSRCRNEKTIVSMLEGKGNMSLNHFEKMAFAHQKLASIDKKLKRSRSTKQSGIHNMRWRCLSGHVCSP